MSWEVKEGVLVKYVGQSEALKIPNSVTTIGHRAFQNCRTLKTIKWIKMPKLYKDSFVNCPSLTLPEEVYQVKKKIPRDFIAFLPDTLHLETICNILLYQDSEFVQACLKMNHSEDTEAVAESLLSVVAKRRTILQEPISKKSVLCFALKNRAGITKKTLQAMVDAYRTVDGITPGWLQKEITLKESRSEETEAWQDLVIYDTKGIPDGYYNEMDYVFEGIAFPKGDFWRIPDEILFQKEEDVPKEASSIHGILNAVQTYADRFMWGPADTKKYKTAARDAYKKSIAAEMKAEVLDHEMLMHILEKWSQISEEYYAPYAAFADEARFKDLLGTMKEWMKEKSLRERVVRVRGAMLLNDSASAIRYADSLNLLPLYAKMRNADVETLRATALTDLGLDEEGRRSWILAGRKVTAVLKADLSFKLVDEETGKEVRSMPKKGADPKDAEKAISEFKDLKKDVSNTVKTQQKKLFDDFLSGKKVTVRQWSDSYLTNPVLRKIAKLIVWVQGDNTFTLDENAQPIKEDGSSFVLGEAEIGVAHPMEMTKEDIASWQGYFISKQLKQPFAQIWEPVADGKTVKPDRYDSCTIPQYMLMNKERHGIQMKGQSGIILRDCTAKLRLVAGREDWINNEFEISNFRFKEYTRAVNHIVTYFDKGTVRSRIMKDDVSVAQWLDRFTLAQIQEFTNLAIENNCANATALLLQYKQDHFGEQKSVLDELVLEDF